jgi:3'(2'), 5'-bisphosphate nucleotidase
METTPEHDLETLVPPLLALCREAGAAICEHYHAPGAGEYRAKGDDSPLTLADLASDRILQAGLPAIGPELPVLSEESGEAVMARRREWRRYWLVDPLDGTREFLARSGEFTINVALVDDHIPVLGLLYQPLARVAHVGIPGLWARRYDADACGGWRSETLEVRRLRPGRPLWVLASRRHRSRRLARCLDWLRETWGELERSDSGSALKFSQLAEGRGDFYPRFARCCEWDTAAGHALLEAAGGRMVRVDGQPLRYNCGDSLYSPNFYAIADGEHPLWSQMLEQFTWKSAD